MSKTIKELVDAADAYMDANATCLNPYYAAEKVTEGLSADECSDLLDSKPVLWTAPCKHIAYSVHDMMRRVLADHIGTAVKRRRTIAAKKAQAEG